MSQRRLVKSVVAGAYEELANIQRRLPSRSIDTDSPPGRRDVMSNGRRVSEGVKNCRVRQLITRQVAYAVG